VGQGAQVRGPQGGLIFIQVIEGHHESTTPPVFASGSGRCRAAGRLAHGEGAGLSGAAARAQAYPTRPCTLAGDITARNMVIGPTRSAVRHREPTGGREQRPGRKGTRRRTGCPATPRHFAPHVARCCAGVRHTRHTTLRVWRVWRPQAPIVWDPAGRTDLRHRHSWLLRPRHHRPPPHSRAPR